MSNLLDVQKPVRYMGSEWNAVTSKPEAKLRFAFSYPDVYEVGMSYLGLQIIYGLLNEQPGVWCERVFCPWPDLEQQMRQSGDILKTLESSTPLHELDALGFSLQHEMLYTNVLTMLDLSQIPVLSKDRTDGDPIILAGGPCAYNPMPMANFIDAFVIGEGEDVILEAAELLTQKKEQGASREDILAALGHIEGIFVPTLYEEIENRLGEVFPYKPKYDWVPDVVYKRLVTDFENSFYPTNQVVPNTKAVHHRLALEVMRGCPGGCRFCQAGYTDRPVRERSPERLKQDAEAGLKSTGFNELGLLSLSTADYTQLPGLCSGLIQKYYPQRVSLSLPSLRIDSFPARVTQEIGKVRSTGMTFAPEAGTERLRWAINKLIYDAEIYAKIRESVHSNQDTIKFYFMVGLPTETDEDLQGIVDMIMNIKQILKEEGKKRAKIHVGLSPFVPKPHTAYHWYGQISLSEIKRRVDYVASRLKPHKVKVNWHDPLKSLVEGALSRGDRRTGDVIYSVWNDGARFDEWHEGFNFTLWEKAFADHGLSIHEVASKTYEQDDILPWDPVSILISKRYLWREWEKTFRTKESRHCGNEMCRVCKICDGDEIVTIHADADIAPKSRYNMEHEMVHALAQEEYQPEGSTYSSEGKTYRYRMRFSKLGHMIYASHHDLMLMFESLCRRTGIQLAFSEGFHPHPKIVFASALAVGTETESDYVEITTIQNYDPEHMLELFNKYSPAGFRIEELMRVQEQSKKITGLVHAFEFDIVCKRGDLSEADMQAIQQTLEHPELMEELNLHKIQLRMLHDGNIVLNYTTHVDGGKFTKFDKISEKLQELLNLRFEVHHQKRKDIYTRTKSGQFEPLIPRKETVMQAQA